MLKTNSGISPGRWVSARSAFLEACSTYSAHLIVTKFVKFTTLSTSEFDAIILSKC